MIEEMGPNLRAALTGQPLAPPAAADPGGVCEVRVYAASDDLIEVEGGTLTEEWSDTEFAEGAYVLASTGDVIRFRLEDEGWRAQIVFDATHPTIFRPTVSPALSVFTDDVVTIAGPVHWITATTARVVRA